jgi:serine/threonine-protein kinase
MTTTPSSGPDRTGQVVDKLRITRLLGAGGMGTVYEARHTFLGRRFAVKFLHTQLAQQAEIMTRFQREAMAAGALESENIAAAVDFGFSVDGAPYIVMEYLEGEDLGALLERAGTLPVPRTVHLVIQACRGLDAAHAAGIVHRDLKPENLYVARHGDGSDAVKILDFGIAKLQSGQPGGSITHTGAAMGTPYYMPPEQARGDKSIDHRADVYALGVILYEALTGQKPHPGDTYNEIMYHILTKEPAQVDALRPGLPAGLGAVVHRAMASNPEDRFGSVVDLASALAPFAGRAVTPIRSQIVLAVASGAETMPAARTGVAAPATSVPRASTLASTTESVPGQAAATASRRNLKPVVAAAVGAAALLALAAGLAMWRPWAGRAAERPPASVAATPASETRAVSGAASAAPPAETPSASAIASGEPVASAAPQASAPVGGRPGGRPAGHSGGQHGRGETATPPAGAGARVGAAGAGADDGTITVRTKGGRAIKVEE